MNIIDIVKKLEIGYKLYSPLLGEVAYDGIVKFYDTECIRVCRFQSDIVIVEYFTAEGEFININDYAEWVWTSIKPMLFVNEHCSEFDWEILNNQISTNHHNLHFTIHVSNSYENFDNPKEFFEICNGKPLGTHQQREQLKKIIDKNQPIEFWTMSSCVLNEIGKYVYENKLESSQIDVILYEDNSTHRHVLYSHDGYLNNWPIGFLD